MYFPIYVSPGGDSVSFEPAPGWVEILPRKSDGSDGRWAWGKDRCAKMKHLLVVRWIEHRSEYDIFVKDALFREGTERQRKFKTLWDSKSFDNQNGTQETKALMGGDFMSYPKPVALMREICLLGTPDGGIVADLFAGSGTTAQAVLEASAEDGKERKLLLIQLDEPLAEDSAAYKAGHATIAHLSRERVRRAGNQVLNGTNNESWNRDVGFRVLKVDTTNMADVLRAPDQLVHEALDLYTDSVKPGRTGEDLLFQVMIDWGLELTMPIAVEQIDGHEMFVVEDGSLIACFVDGVSPAVVREIAGREPLRGVFRDSGFATDADRINAEQVFAEVSPATDVKTI
jgi:adenine-specific DNA-methyltransferase